MTKLRKHKSVLLIIMILIASVALTGLATTTYTKYSPNLNGVAKTKEQLQEEAYKEANPNNIPDPNYPVEPEYKTYTMKVPSLEDRLTLSSDQQTATLFAPHTKFSYNQKEGGWYDREKIYTVESQDSAMCWACASTNLLAWYYDIADGMPGYDLSGIPRDVESIFKQFHDSWKNEAYNVYFGLNWYFTGQFSDKKTPSEINIYPSGGFLRNRVPFVTRDSLTNMINNDFHLWGNYEKQIPIFEGQDEIYHAGGAISDIHNFSKTLIRQLHYGALSISVGKAGASGAGGMHAINCWGCDYDAKTGLVTKVYLTDNSDTKKDTLFAIDIIDTGLDHGGIRMEGYMPAHGTQEPFECIADCIVLFSPDAIQPKEIKDKTKYNGDSPQINYIEVKGEDIIISAKEIYGEQLEYGVSYNRDGYTNIKWQDSNTFSGMAAGSYYVFVRVKENDNHYSSDPSSPRQATVITEKIKQQIQSISLGTSGLHGYDSTTNSYNYIWFGEIDGNPILWRVLDDHANDGSINDRGMLLLSENILDIGLFSYVQSGSQNDYKQSFAKIWNENFVSQHNHFFSSERDAIMLTNKYDYRYNGGEDPNADQNPELVGQNIYYGQFSYPEAPGSILNNAQLFFLSVPEMRTESYGFTTEYNPNNTAKYYNQYEGYWSRSSKVTTTTCVGISDSVHLGEVVFGNATITPTGMRPAFNLDKSKVLFTSAVGNANNNINAWTSANTVTSQGIKLTLKDTSRYFDITDHSTINAKSNGRVTLSYTGANSGNNEYISVIITDHTGAPVAYSKVAYSDSYSGDISFDLPSYLNTGSYTLNIFNEHESGEMRTNYASDFVSIPLNITENGTDISGGGQTHHHSPTLINRQNPTCERDGYEEYYYCAGCDGYFEDRACTRKIDNINVWLGNHMIDRLGHSYRQVGEVQWLDNYTRAKIVAECTHDSYHTDYEITDVQKTTKPATETETGLITYTARFSSNWAREPVVTKEVIIPTLQHKCTAILVPAVPATCGHTGLDSYYKCSECGKVYEDADCQREITNMDAWRTKHTIPMTEHDYTVTYDWAPDYSFVDAYAVCKNDSRHTAHERAFSSSSSKEPTEYEDGAIYYEAYFGNSWAKPQTHTEILPALKHTHSLVIVRTPATCGAEGVQDYYKCEKCGKYYEDSLGGVEIINLDSWKKSHSIPKLEHDYVVTYDWSSDYSRVTATAVCQSNPSHTLVENGSIIVTRVEPTEYVDGKITYTATFASKYFAKQVRTVVLPALKHTHSLVLVHTPATCERDGVTDYYICQSCGKYFEDSQGKVEITDIAGWMDSHKIAKLNHDYYKITYEWSSDNTSVTATAICRHDPSHTLTETVQATATVDSEDASITHYLAVFESDWAQPQKRTKHAGIITSGDKSNTIAITAGVVGGGVGAVGLFMFVPMLIKKLKRRG